MHTEVLDFCNYVKEIFPNFFFKKRILEVGSGDINGTCKNLFDNTCVYEGNDLVESPNTTIISKTSTLPFDNETFDVIYSTECFEHDPEFILSIQKIHSMLKPGGLFFFTCASTGRQEHGTQRTTPTESWATRGNIPQWQDHYKNITINDLEVTRILDDYTDFHCYYNYKSFDFYFWGIKKSSKDSNKLFINRYDNYGIYFIKEK